MDIDRTEHGGYRREVASKLGLHGNGRMTSEKPIKRASGGSIPKLATGGALKNLGKAMRHDFSSAARKTRGAFKDFGRKEKEGFENIGHKINRDVIKPSERGFEKHVANPTRRAAATAKNMAKEIGNDINKNVIKPTGRYLKESAHKDHMANGGMPSGRGRSGMMYPAVMPPQGMPRQPMGRNRIPANAQTFAPQQAPMMKSGGLKRMGKGAANFVSAGEAYKHAPGGSRVKDGMTQRARNLATAGKANKHAFDEAHKCGGKIKKMAHGGVGKIRHGVTPSNGIVHAKFQDKKEYM